MESRANASSFLQLLAGQVLSRMTVGVILTDADGRIEWVNDRQQWFTGVPPQGLLGYSMFEHPGLFFEALHDALQYALVKGKMRQILLRQHHLHCRIEVTPLFVEGRLLGAAVCFYEVTAAAAEAEDPLNQLVADEQRAMVRMLSALLDGLPLAVAAVTRDGAVLYVNAPWRTTIAGDALDRPLAEMLPEPARSSVAAALAASWKEGSGRHVESSTAAECARHFWVAPLPANPELTLGLVAVLPAWPGGTGGQNHFALQLTNLCQFAGHIVHDIRNPLTTLKCELEVLRDENLYEEGGAHRFQEAIDLFETQVREITEILDQIEPMGADAPGPVDAVSVVEVVRNAHFVAEWRRPYKSVHIELDLPEDLPSLTCDGVRLQKALTGLLLHALDQAGVAGAITFKVEQLRPDTLGLRLLFRTAGSGLNQPLPPRPPWNSKDIVLAMAYAVIIELDGTFDMQRRHTGETEIVITLPGLDEAAPAAAGVSHAW